MGSLARDRILAPVTVANGAANYFAGASSVLVVDSALVELSGVYIDINGFTNGATLTATITIKVGAALNQRQFQLSYVKNANNTIWAILQSEIPLHNNANTIIIALQSDNAGDVAVAVPVSYFLRYD